MALRIFVTKPPVVRGLQWTTDNYDEFAEFGGLIRRTKNCADCLEFMDADGDWHYVLPGEWLITDAEHKMHRRTHADMVDKYDQITATTIPGTQGWCIETEDGYKRKPVSASQETASSGGSGSQSSYKPANESRFDIYGYCPECGSLGYARERRLNGNDTCIKGHIYPSASALQEKPK